LIYIRYFGFFVLHTGFYDVIIISAFVLRWNYRQLLGIAKQIFTNWFLGHRQNIFSIKKKTSR